MDYFNFDLPKSEAGKDIGWLAINTAAVTAAATFEHEAMRPAAAVDWGCLPLVITGGSVRGGGNIAMSHPHYRLKNGREVSLARLCQQHRGLGRLCGRDEHPLQPAFQLIQRAVEGTNVPVSSVVLVPPQRLYMRRVRIRNENGDEPVLADLFEAPVMASYAEFTSSTVDPDECSSALVLAWFDDGTGIPDYVVRYLVDKVDWERTAVSWSP